MFKELQVPPFVRNSDQVWEVFRAFTLSPDNKLFICVDVAVFKDSRAWGVALADLARHIANSYETMGVAQSEKVLDSIVKQFDVEVAHPTSEIDVPNLPGSHRPF